MAAKKRNKTQLDRLVWHKPRRQWKKTYRGVTKRLGPPNVSPYDANAYEAALVEWHRFKAEMDAGAGAQKPNPLYILAAQQHRQLAELMAAAGTDAQQGRAQELQEQSAVLERRATDPKQQSEWLDDRQIDPLANADDEAKAHWQTVAQTLERVSGQQQSEAKPKEMTVGELADQYLKLKFSQAKSGDRSIGTYDAIRCKMLRILKWTGRDKAVTFLNDANLERYYIHLLEKAKTNAEARDSFKYFKVLARYAMRLNLINPLKRLDDRDLSFSKQPQEIIPMPINHWRKLYDAADEQVKLYLLLMANCGFYQSDISDLTPSEVDFENGYIIRKRSKAKRDYKNAPKVQWKLWPKTLELLRKYGNKNDKYVLTNQKGQQLRCSWLKADGKRTNRDNIRTAVQRLEKKHSIEHVQLKRIRKASATQLWKEPTYSRFTQYFLGQSPTDVLGLHYAQVDQDQFDEAVHWLGQQYGVIDAD